MIDSGLKERRPYVILNMAQSINGYISGRDGERVQISSEYDSKRVMELRNSVDAIMIGGNTLRSDNPFLKSDNCRFRIVLKSDGILHMDSNIFKSEGTVIIVNESKETVHGNTIWISGGKPVDLKIAMNKIYSMGIRRILLEGGKKTAMNFLRDRLVDEMYLFIGDIFIEEGGIKMLDNSKRIKEIIVNAEIMDKGILLRLNPEKIGEAL